MDINTNDIIEIIAELGDKAKQDVLAHFAYAMEQQRDAKFKPAHRAAWEALCVVSDDSRHVPPLATFATTFGKAKLMAALDVLNDFADRSCSKALTQTERLAVLRLITQCLADHLKSVETANRKRMVIRPTSLINNFGSLAMAVDMCFPGYAASKLLDRVALMRPAA